MYPVLLLAFLPQISAYVDCKIACYRCRENKEHPLILEVHCAMCTECKQRRRDRLNLPLSHRTLNSSDPPIDTEHLFLEKQALTLAGHSNKRQDAHTTRRSKKSMNRHADSLHDDHSREYHSGHESQHSAEGEAESSEECPTPPPCEESEEFVPIKLIKRTTTTRATTTKKRCPPVVHCRKKKRKPECNTCCTPCMPMCAAPCPQSTTTMAPVTTTDYLYVYVGVPKGLIN